MNDHERGKRLECELNLYSNSQSFACYAHSPTQVHAHAYTHTYTNTDTLVRVHTPSHSPTHSTGLPTIVRLRLRATFITQGRLSTFPGQIIKSNSRNPHTLPSTTGHLQPRGVWLSGMSVWQKKKKKAGLCQEKKKESQKQKQKRCQACVYCQADVSGSSWRSLWLHSENALAFPQ